MCLASTNMCHEVNLIGLEVLKFKKLKPVLVGLILQLHTHTYTNIHTYIHTYTHSHTYTQTYIHTHTYIYTHTYTHTYIYKHT